MMEMEFTAQCIGRGRGGGTVGVGEGVVKFLLLYCFFKV